MNNEMAGKIRSAVSGLSEVSAATAKELNATRTAWHKYMRLGRTEQVTYEVYPSREMCSDL